MNIEVRQGDIFASRSMNWLGKSIRWFQRFKSTDREAEYNHVGIIIDDKGTTYEALKKIKRQNLFKAYKGEKVLIVRYSEMTPEVFQKGFDSVKGDENEIYPWYRLILHAFGGSRRIHFTGNKVCSEVVGCFQYYSGMVTLAGKNYYGLTPDNHVDEWRISRHASIVFEGVL